MYVIDCVTVTGCCNDYDHHTEDGSGWDQHLLHTVVDGNYNLSTTLTQLIQWCMY